MAPKKRAKVSSGGASASAAPAPVAPPAPAPLNVSIYIQPKERDEDDEDDDEYDMYADDHDDLGYPGDYECTRRFSATIRVNGAEAGSISAILVDRDVAGAEFHSACDAESAELQESGCVFFGSNGKPRYPALKSDASAQRGGYLYISDFVVNAEHCQHGATDVGSAALKALLTSPDVAPRWSVASYIAEGRSPGPRRHFFDAPETPEARANRLREWSERQARDSRQFLRVGFAEAAYKDGGWLYVTKGMMRAAPAMTHEQALALPLRTATAAADPAGSATGEAAPSAEDEKLLETLMRSVQRETSAAVLAKIDEAKAAGADLTRAGALQCLAANRNTALMQPLIARGADVNGKDTHGCTPLMIAAEGAAGQTTMSNRTHDSSIIAHLIALGADKNVTHSDGRSALGHYYAHIRSLNDMNAALLGGPGHKVDAAIVAMLKPSGGPTSADRDNADDHD